MQTLVLADDRSTYHLWPKGKQAHRSNTECQIKCYKTCAIYRQIVERISVSLFLCAKK